MGARPRGVGMSFSTTLISAMMFSAIRSGPILPGKPIGRCDVQVAPVESFVVAPVDGVILRHAGRDRDGFVTRPERIRSRNPRARDGIAAADITGKVSAEARSPPGVGGRPDVPTHDVNALHWPTPHRNDVVGAGVEHSVATERGEPLQAFLAEPHFGGWH